MNIFLYITLVTAIAGVVGTGLGGGIGAVLNRNSGKTVSLLLSFAGGVMLSIVCFDLISEAIDSANSVYFAFLWVLVGYLAIYGLNTWIDKATNHEVKHIDPEHPKTADDLDELIHSDHFVEHKNSRQSLFLAGIVMACAIALHNLPEGMVIGAAYVGSQPGNLLSGGFLMALVIGLHNIPEGMAVSVPLISGGMNKGKAVLLSALSGAPTILGALLGYLLGALNPMMLSVALGFASGAMLYVVFGELLPESILMWRSKLPALATLIGILVGVMIIYL